MLFGCDLNMENQDDELVVEPNLSYRALHVNKVLDLWWNSWGKDYLVELRKHQRKRNRVKKLTPNKGNVVKRSQWRLGRIIKLLSEKMVKSKMPNWLHKTITQLGVD